jgi:hypothetical protein
LWGFKKKKERKKMLMLFPNPMEIEGNLVHLDSSLFYKGDISPSLETWNPRNIPEG